MGIDQDNVSALKRHREDSPPDGSDMSMMRIAVAGTGGLAHFIAHYIDEDTAHQVVFISRMVCIHPYQCPLRPLLRQNEVCLKQRQLLYAY